MRCDLSPFGMECANSNCTRSTKCCVHHLNCALANTFQSIPVIGNLIKDYHCPDFKLMEDSSGNKY